MTINFYFFADGSLSHIDDADTAIFRCRKWVKEDHMRKVLQIRNTRGKDELLIYRNEEITYPAMMIWRSPKDSELPQHIQMMKLIGAI